VVTAVTGDSRADTINRSLQLYAVLSGVLAEGKAVYIGARNGSGMERVRIT
jgi:hypothetical protein